MLLKVSSLLASIILNPIQQIPTLVTGLRNSSIKTRGTTGHPPSPSSASAWGSSVLEPAASDAEIQGISRDFADSEVGNINVYIYIYTSIYKYTYIFLC